MSSEDNRPLGALSQSREITNQDERKKKSIISQLKKGVLCVRDIPEEYKDDITVIAAERKLGLRRLFRCGYDVIKDLFFVEEDVLYIDDESKWTHLLPVYFDDFKAYYNYLEGNIYENACYYLLDTKKVPDDIDKNKLFDKCSFIEDTISDYTLSMTDEEQAEYNSAEERKEEAKKWIKKFNNCVTFQQLERTVQIYNKTELRSFIDVSFYFWHFIFKDINDESRFRLIMEYMSSGIYPSYKICKALCAIYDPDIVIENYKYELGSYPTCRSHIRDMKQIAKNVKEGQYKYTRLSYFDDHTHFYCVKTEAFEQGYKYPIFSYCRYFENITSLITFLNGDLTYCDLSKAQDIQVDFSKYITDNTTKLPITQNEEYEYIIRKEYRHGEFRVFQVWKGKRGNIIKSYKHVFNYLCDFVAFLQGDLSQADLISCDGLNHISPTDQINLQGALVISEISEKWGIPYEHIEASVSSDIFFELTQKNETETAMILHSSRELATSSAEAGLSRGRTYDSLTERIYYISDIHLYHLLKNKRIKSKSDVIKIIRDLVSSIVQESDTDSIILINGDTSLKFSVFQLFTSELARYHRTVIFTIGNHDMWSCPDDTIDQLSERYRAVLKSKDMYLLQNDVLFFYEFDQPPEHISEQEIIDSTEEKLRDRIKLARLILFGGTGFAGYNQFFNAETGLYRHNKTIGYNRDIELKETQRFEKLYKKIVSAFHGKNTVIMTHMPLPDWYKPTWEQKSESYSKDRCQEADYRIDHPNDNVGTYSLFQPGFIYLSGHNHRNYFYDDGSIRIYADNQFGYNMKNPSAWPHLKYFEVDKAIDIFADYKDGIYEITADEYRLFNRCKNIYMEFNRENNKIFMLKKSDYYCFISQAKNKRLSIMNGGALRHLDNKDINYYYDNMDSVISIIKGPLDQYTAYQKRISEEIKKIGGWGSIHGCIVDIDFYNHIYVNPRNGTATGYWASDIIKKLIYPTIPALLEAHCPEKFALYQKMLSEGTQEQSLALSGKGNIELALKPILYLNTDIYSTSRQIKKMQKSNSNILSTWLDNLPKQPETTIGNENKKLAGDQDNSPVMHPKNNETLKDKQSIQASLQNSQIAVTTSVDQIVSRNIDDRGLSYEKVDDFLLYVKSKEIRTMDNRFNDGCVWVEADPQIEDMIMKVRIKGRGFKHAKQCLVFNGRPGWYY